MIRLGGEFYESWVHRSSMFLDLQKSHTSNCRHLSPEARAQCCWFFPRQPKFHTVIERLSHQSTDIQRYYQMELSLLIRLKLLDTSMSPCKTVLSLSNPHFSINVPYSRLSFRKSKSDLITEQSTHFFLD